MTAQLEKKRSSRWNVFKKRRKKKLEQQNGTENEKQCVTPPRSDATTAASETNSLLGRIVTKKRSPKRNEASSSNEDSVYAPPEIEFKPSFGDTANGSPPTAKASNAVLARPVDTPPKQRVATKTASGIVPATKTPPRGKRNCVALYLMLKLRRWSSTPKNQVKRRKAPHRASWI